MFSKIILNQDLDFNQGTEQAGFRRGFSTMDHIQTLNEVTERNMNFQYVWFKDFEKVFESILGNTS